MGAAGAQEVWAWSVQVLCTCHLGATAGAVVSTEQGCPDVHCAEVTLVAWGELGRAGGLGPTEAVDQPGCPNPAPVHAVMVEGKW